MKKSEALRAFYELARLAEDAEAEITRVEALGGEDERLLDKALPRKREMLAMRVGIVEALATAYAILVSDLESHEQVDYEALLSKMYDQGIEEIVVMRTGYKRRNDD